MIRPFMPADMNAVLNIWLEASIQAHDFVNSDFWHSKLNLMQEVYIPSSETYVYEDAEGIKGFFSLYNNTLAAIFVNPSDQGSGIGQQLLLKAKSLRNKLDLTVYRDNKKSIKFYQQNDFTTIKEQIDKHTGMIEILMTYNPTDDTRLTKN
ncbi:GNAT family N-acetyltransferase [Endozoicomonas sp. SM1973]|uniref:GNAT family N-acetyltransferase n=2 Tax=Spartinivicinus marinus TaxID=2994442 RepID=A0A853I5A9_9GAMM|nr:GNAT family N-acetyltransferase [Spartinivicinus marinus]MCX4026883.1 GNAT family N-acetyltransferase [Spartinivicinus marinus]NYZ66772.1 GNAT family N-acetyltransferase [Spartinivicinus marinus]